MFHEPIDTIDRTSYEPAHAQFAEESSMGHADPSAALIAAITDLQEETAQFLPHVVGLSRLVASA